MSRLDRIKWKTSQLKIFTPRSAADVYANTFRSIWRLLPDEAEFISQSVYYGDVDEEASFSAKRKMLELRNNYLNEFNKQ